MIAGGTRDVWLLQRNDDGPFRVARLDGDTGALRAYVDGFDPAPMNGDSAQLAVGASALWIAAGHAMLYRVDVRDNRVVAAIDVGPHHLDGLAVAEGSVFVSDFHMLARVDASNHAVVVGDVGATGLAFVDGVLWGKRGTSVVTLDPRSLRESTSTDLGAHVLSIQPGLGAVWALTQDAADPDRSTLWEVPGPGVHPVARARVPALAAMVVGVGGVWLAWSDEGARVLHRVDLASGTLEPVPAARMWPDATDAESVWGRRHEADGTGCVVRYWPATGVASTLGALSGDALAIGKNPSAVDEAFDPGAILGN